MPLGDEFDAAVRVSKIKVTGLFGLYDHEINFKLGDRVTILHGPNGVGKSVLLRLVAAFFGGRYAEFTQTPFDTFAISLTDGSLIEIRVEETKAEQITYRTVHVAVTGSNIEPISYVLPVTRAAERLARDIERQTPYLQRVSDSIYFDSRTSQRISSEEVVERYGSAQDVASMTSVPLESEPQAAKTIRGLITVQLVETQRLLRVPPDARFYPEAYYVPPSDRKTMIATVRSYSEDIVRQVSRTLSRYGTESQKLDQTFPQRLIRSNESLNTQELKDRLNSLDQQHATLNTLGLIDRTFSYPAQSSEIDALDETKRNVMALYVRDTEAKLKFLSELAVRIQLLVVSVNGKFRNKTLSVSRERGLQITDRLGRPVSLEALSSGEQHELVLWYDLLFKVNSNALVLIDEPELSLHVTWQKKFLPELLEIAKTVPFDALVATHSPFIIGDRLDLTVPLDADVEQ
jgi:predicted ATP-binding protein involved in virulence